MKIKCFFALIFAMALLPIFANALDKNYCDNNVYQSYYDRYNGKNVTDDVRFVMGNKYNRGVYINETLEYCKHPEARNHYRCDWAYFGGDRDPLRDKAVVNMPTFALLLNNIPLFEALITKGGYSNLLDNGIYEIAEDHYNDEFLTQAFMAVREGQVGILEYLIENYDPNLLKLVGYIHRAPHLPKAPKNVKEYAEYYKERWANRGDNQKRECMVAVQKVIEDWYQKNAHKKKYIDEAERYNKIVLEWAPKYVVENNMPFEFTPSLDMFKLQGIVEENFAQNLENIDGQINMLMGKIMRDFDFSAFGNKI